MADTDTLIDSAVSRTNNLLSLAQQMANIASEAGWNYKTAVNGASGRVGAYKIDDAYSIAAPISLPVDRPVYTVETDLSAEFRGAFDEAFATFHADMEAGLAEYLATWFPECITAKTDDWICNTILTGGKGIPSDIEAQIWQRARGRESEESLKLEQDALDQFAMRGFSIPPGALAARLLRVQQDATLRATGLSRDLAIETFKAYREDVKFAVEQGVKVRLGVLGALGDFIRAWTSPQGNATEIARAAVDSKSKLTSTAADYYRAIIAEADLSLKAHQIMQSSYDTTQQMRARQDFESENLGVSGGTQAAGMYTQMAVSAANSLVSLVGSEKQLIGQVA